VHRAIPGRQRKVTNLQIDQRECNGAVVLGISGEVGMLEFEAMSAKFREVLANSPRLVVLDLSGVPMIASAGMGAMVALRRDTGKYGGKVRLAAVRPQVREALKRALFERIFEFFDTVEAAAVI
jgi:anti-sigma B factor antagonist